MRITILGAAGGEVTGSCYFVQTKQTQLLVDCGLFQGGRKSEALNRPPAGARQKLDAVVLTHTHLDHTGRLPLLTKRDHRMPVSLRHQRYHVRPELPAMGDIVTL